MDLAQRRILEDIIQGKLKPGSVIQLGSLATEYGVSRTPVREALKLLERQELVQAIAYKGYLIRPIEPGDVRDVFFIRRLLEGAAAELASQRIDEAALRRLRDLQPPSDEEMTLQHDEYSREFHRTIIEAAGSPRLTKAFENTYNDVRRLQYAGIGSSRRPDLIHNEHETILRSLEAGDAKSAREEMEKHIELMRTRALNDWVSGE